MGLCSRAVAHNLTHQQSDVVLHVHVDLLMEYVLISTHTCIIIAVY